MTAGEVAAALGVSLTTVKRRARKGTLPVVTKLEGRTGAHLFDREAIRQLAAARSSAASLSVLAAGVVVPEGGVLPGFVGLAAAGVLAVGAIVIGVRELRRPAVSPVSPVPVGMSWVEWAALEIGQAPVRVCPHRGRVYSALNGEFWRSSLDGSWLFGQGCRLEQIDPADSVIWRALNRRDASEQMSVVA